MFSSVCQMYSLSAMQKLWSFQYYSSISVSLNKMHQHPLLIDYPFMYSKGDKNVAQRIGTMESDDLVETDSIFGQIIYWVGFWALFAFAPLTLLALLAMICTRIWKTRGNYKEPPFKFICQENKTKSDWLYSTIKKMFVYLQINSI